MHHNEISMDNVIRYHQPHYDTDTYVEMNKLIWLYQPKGFTVVYGWIK